MHELFSVPQISTKPGSGLLWDSIRWRWLLDAIRMRPRQWKWWCQREQERGKKWLVGSSGSADSKNTIDSILPTEKKIREEAWSLIDWLEKFIKTSSKLLKAKPILLKSIFLFQSYKKQFAFCFSNTETVLQSEKYELSNIFDIKLPREHSHLSGKHLEEVEHAVGLSWSSTIIATEHWILFIRENFSIEKNNQTHK